MEQIAVDKLSKMLTDRKLWGTSFKDMKAVNLQEIAEIFLENIDPGIEYSSPPSIIDGELRIPHNAPHKYRWWAGGQSIKETLAELGADQDVIDKYCGGM
ncbi:MAG: hypothetical protein GY849_06125 [Deltaproteobacteria bacterium]|nr:hypothetical protein [Deltaproteobacteria bacterium]